MDDAAGDAPDDALRRFIEVDVATDPVAFELAGVVRGHEQFGDIDAEPLRDLEVVTAQVRRECVRAR